MAEPLISLCADCAMNTTPCTGKRGCRHKGKWEYYMVRERVWRAAGVESGYLCIGCLERRIRRQLTWQDFTSAPINDVDTWDTPRLASRKARR